MNEPFKSTRKTLPELLQARDYQVFDHLVHEVTEEFIRAQNWFVTTCQLIPIQVGEDLPAAPIAPELKAALLSAEQRFKEMLSQPFDYAHRLRCMLYPGGCMEDENVYVASDESFRRTEQINRERWQPYDEVAWDKMYAPVVELMTPLLHLYVPAVNELKSLLPRFVDVEDNEWRNWHAWLTRCLEMLEHYHKELQILLNPQKLKAELWY